MVKWKKLKKKDKQVVLYGIHPKTGEPYSWPEGELVGVVPEDLPLVSEETLREIVAEAERIVRLVGIVAVDNHLHGLRRFPVGERDAS